MSALPTLRPRDDRRRVQESFRNGSQVIQQRTTAGALRVRKLNQAPTHSVPARTPRSGMAGRPCSPRACSQIRAPSPPRPIAMPRGARPPADAPPRARSATERHLLDGDTIERNAESQRISHVVVPNLGAVVHPMPPGAFAGSQKEPDGRARLIAVRLAIPAALRMPRQAEQVDDIVGVHQPPRWMISVGGRRRREADPPPRVSPSAG